MGLPQPNTAEPDNQGVILPAEGLPPTVFNITPLQSRFVDEYVKDLNASQAALRAGFSAGSYGRELITKSEIKAAIARRQQLAQKQTGITINSVINELAILYAKTQLAEEYSTCTRILELLGKHVGAFSADKVSTGGKVVVNMNFTKPDNPQSGITIEVEPDEEQNDT